MTTSYAPFYYAEIASLQTAISQLRAHAPSKRTTALIERREERIEELMAHIEMGSEGADDSLEVVETSDALDAAIETAKAVGCAVVTGVSSMALEMERLVPGCSMRQGNLYVSTVCVDGGELRLVRRAGSYQGAMRWRAH